VSGASPGANWAGSYTYAARTLHRPTTREQLQELVAGAPSVHVLGSRHSFNGIADAAELISLDALPADIVVDAAAGTVSLGGGVTYGGLVEILAEHGLALHNLASLPHISVAGAVATATHGSGVAHGNLATAVRGLELVTSDGEVITAARGDVDFDGMVVGLGALGAVSRLTLDIEPAYEVRQRVFEGLGWSTLAEHFDVIMAAGYSVSVFTRWGERVGDVRIKSRTDVPEQVGDDLFGAVPATVERHPIPGLDPAPCTPQRGLPGAWSDRLPHFRMGFTPSAGEEIQSEYLVPRDAALAAVEALRRLGDRMRPVLQVCEIRTVTADRLWMSMNHARDSVAFHFTWRLEPERVRAVVVDIERALAPFGARPHWGKLFTTDAATIAGLYERHGDFVGLQARLDRRGAFRTPWLEAHVLGAAEGAARP
jgi:alditol oxidase